MWVFDVSFFVEFLVIFLGSYLYVLGCVRWFFVVFSGFCLVFVCFLVCIFLKSAFFCKPWIILWVFFGVYGVFVCGFSRFWVCSLSEFLCLWS